MTRGLRNNNPGNIRISSTKYQGEIQPSQDSAFKQFETMPYGYRAMFMVLYTYQKKYGLNTIEELINRYAPSNENNTNGYIQRVSKQSGIPANQPINTQDKSQMIPIVSAMSEVENGVPAVKSDVEQGWNLFVS